MIFAVDMTSTLINEIHVSTSVHTNFTLNWSKNTSEPLIEKNVKMYEIHFKRTHFFIVQHDTILACYL